MFYLLHKFMQQQLLIHMTFSQKSIGRKRQFGEKQYYINGLWTLPKIICTCPINLLDNAIDPVKNAQLFLIHRHLRDRLMQSVLGTSATVGFQLDLGVKLGVFYYTLLDLTREKLMRNDTVTY